MLRKDFLKTINGSAKEKRAEILKAYASGEIENTILLKTRLKNIFTDGQDNDIFNNNVIAAYLDEKNINSDDTVALLSTPNGEKTADAYAFELSESIKKLAKKEYTKGMRNKVKNEILKEKYNQAIQIFKDNNIDGTFTEKQIENIIGLIFDYTFTGKTKQVQNDGLKAVFSCVACVKNEGTNAGFTWIYREFLFDIDGTKSEIFNKSVQVVTNKPILSEFDLYNNNLENLISVIEKASKYTENYKNLNNLTFNEFRKEQFEKLENVRTLNSKQLETMLKEYKRYSIEF